MSVTQASKGTGKLGIRRREGRVDGGSGRSPFASGGDAEQRVRRAESDRAGEQGDEAEEAPQRLGTDEHEAQQRKAHDDARDSLETVRVFLKQVAHDSIR